MVAGGREIEAVHGVAIDSAKALPIGPTELGEYRGIPLAQRTAVVVDKRRGHLWLSLGFCSFRISRHPAMEFLPRHFRLPFSQFQECSLSVCSIKLSIRSNCGSVNVGEYLSVQVASRYSASRHSACRHRATRYRATRYRATRYRANRYRKMFLLGLRQPKTQQIGDGTDA